MPPRIRTLERKQRQRQARRQRRLQKAPSSAPSESPKPEKPGRGCLPPNAKRWQESPRA